MTSGYVCYRNFRLFSLTSVPIQTIETMVSGFGSIESFGLYVHTPNPTEDTEEYPPPHNAARAPGMENRVWEVKWRYRDECVCAFMVCICVLFYVESLKYNLDMNWTDFTTRSTPNRYLGPSASAAYAHSNTDVVARLSRHRARASSFAPTTATLAVPVFSF